jgi:endonuclease/exonuclease/phosphatase family protein
VARRCDVRSPARWALPALLAVALVTSGCSGSEPGAAPSPTSSATASTGAPDPEPSPSASAGTALPTTPAYPSVATLDRRMARKGLHRVAPSTWAGATFRVATFNLLGASHTRPPHGRRGYAPADARMPHEVRVLERSGATVVGMQEFQAPQVRQFRALLGERWAVYPGLQLGPQPGENSIVWRTDVWTMVRQRTTPVTYFYGNQRPMPLVLLRNNESGRLVWFANFHNPADVRGDAARWRDQALATEARLARRLGRGGTPVVLTGDMNAKAAFACPFTARSGMHSADGALTRAGQCLLPADVDIDWIFGSAPVQFSDFTNDQRPRRLRFTDHPLVHATATLLPVQQRPECTARLSASGAVWYCRKR